MKKYIIFIILTLMTSSFIYAQYNPDWKWMHPKPQGNDIRFIKALSSTNWVAVGYLGTLMRTSNAGTSWEVYSNYLGTATGFLGQGKNIYGADFKDANTGVAVGTQGFITRTTNGGLTWDSIPSPAGTTALWNASFGDANTVYASGNSGMVLKSTNAGLTWTIVTSPSSNQNWSIYALDANTVFTVTNSGMVYKSVNGGSSWTSSNVGSSQALYGVFFFDANTGVASGNAGTLKYTTNGGTSWNATSVVSTKTLRLRGMKGTNVIYSVGDGTFIFKSTDNGVNWTNINYNFPGQTLTTYTTPNTMDISGNTWIIGGVNGLLNKSTDGGTTWTGNEIFNVGNVFDIEIRPGGKIWAVGNPGIGGSSIFYSSNNGTTWASQINQSVYLRQIDMVNDLQGWIVGNAGLIYNTTNGGQQWNLFTIPGGSTGSVVYVEFANDNTGWIFNYGYMPGGSIFKTTNAGNNWTQQENGSTNEGVKWADMVDANTGYYITSSITNTQLYKTTNGGTNWILQTIPFSGQNLTMVRMVNANSGYVVGFGGDLMKTTNGTNWTIVTTPATNNYTSIDMIDMNNVYLGGGSGLIVRTGDGGNSWISMNTGGSTVNRIKAVHADTVWTAELFGFIHKYVRGSTPVVEWKNEVPADYVLNQNYPNPFNPSTMIRFSIPKNSNVALNVFDINGRSVGILLDNANFNAGTITVPFDASGLASGVYFYSLIVDGQKIASKKMILQK